MSAPDFIWAMPDAQDWEWGSCAWDVRRPLVGSREYVRRDPAVLAELPEVRALVAAALQPLLKAADMLSVCAQTTGGTAGRDDGLVAAIAAYSEARALIEYEIKVAQMKKDFPNGI